MPAQVKVIDRAFNSLEKQNAQYRAREERREQEARQEAREKEKEAREKKSNEPDAVSSTSKAVLDAIQGAATAGQTMLLESIRATNREKDPLEYHKNVMETAKSLNPGGGGSDKIIELVLASNEKALATAKESSNSIVTMVLANQKSLETRLDAAEKRNAELHAEMMKLMIQSLKPAEQSASNPLAPRSPMDMFSEISKMMTGVLGFVDKLSDRAPRGGDSSIWSRIAEKVVDVAPNVMYNYSLAQRAAAAVAVKGNSTLPEPQAPGQEGGEEEESSATPTEEEIALQFLDRIEQPLIHSLTAGATGQEFGALMMKTFGADTYEFIANQSDDSLFQLLRHNLNIWSTVQRMSARFVAFLQEFRDRSMVTRIFQQMSTMASTAAAAAAAAASTAPPPTSQPRPARPAPASTAATTTATAPAPSGVPSQVSRRLKPGQRVVHTPKGPVVVDSTASVIPDTDITDPGPDPYPDPASASPATV